MRDVKRGNPTAAITLQVRSWSHLLTMHDVFRVCHNVKSGKVASIFAPAYNAPFQYDKLYVDNKCYVWNDLQVHNL